MVGAGSGVCSGAVVSAGLGSVVSGALGSVVSVGALADALNFPLFSSTEKAGESGTDFTL